MAGVADAVAEEFFGVDRGGAEPELAVDAAGRHGQVGGEAPGAAGDDPDVGPARGGEGDQVADLLVGSIGRDGPYRVLVEEGQDGDVVLRRQGPGSGPCISGITQGMFMGGGSQGAGDDAAAGEDDRSGLPFQGGEALVPPGGAVLHAAGAGRERQQLGSLLLLTGVAHLGQACEGMVVARGGSAGLDAAHGLGGAAGERRGLAHAEGRGLAKVPETGAGDDAAGLGGAGGTGHEVPL